ncbi:hypothetical protein PM082_008953 [Marasmius tenuissimus]|nr:hypothetical protein PM082_008953 [Marasmius tenuissimus]
MPAPPAVSYVTDQSGNTVPVWQQPQITSRTRSSTHRHQHHIVCDQSRREIPERILWSSGDQSTSTKQSLPWESNPFPTNSEVPPKIRQRKPRTPATAVAWDSARKHKNSCNDVYGVNDQRFEVFNGPVTINNNHYANGSVYNASSVGTASDFRQGLSDANHPVQGLPTRAEHYSPAIPSNPPMPTLNPRNGYRSPPSPGDCQGHKAYNPKRTEAGPTAVPSPPYYQSGCKRRREPSVSISPNRRNFYHPRSGPGVPTCPPYCDQPRPGHPLHDSQPARHRIEPPVAKVYRRDSLRAQPPILAGGIPPALHPSYDHWQETTPFNPSENEHAK